MKFNKYSQGQLLLHGQKHPDKSRSKPAPQTNISILNKDRNGRKQKTKKIKIHTKKRYAIKHINN